MHIQSLDYQHLEEALTTLGEVLAHRGEAHYVVLIGGSALLHLGLVTRTTYDVDVVGLMRDGRLVGAEPMPASLRAAADDVARALGLATTWFNSAPTTLLDFGLPNGFLERCCQRRYGTLGVSVAARLDQVHFKLYAATDQGPRSKHMADLQALHPTSEELLAAARWCRTQDPSEGFLSSLRPALAFMEVRDADI